MLWFPDKLSRRVFRLFFSITIDDGWRSVRRKTSAPVFGSLSSPAIPSNGGYFPKDFDVENPEEENHDLVVSSVRLPAARGVQYDPTRGLDNTTLTYGHTERSDLLFEHE